MHNIKKIPTVLLGMLVILFCAKTASPALSPAATVTPPQINIGLFFSGKRVSIAGPILPGRDVVVEIKGPEKKSVFNMKGRVGPFWMNVQKVELEKAPFLYMLLLPEGKDLLPVLSSMGIGINEIKRRMVVKPETVSPDTIFPSFVQLKQADGLYKEMEGAVQYSQAKDGARCFKAEFFMPSSIVPEEYNIVISVFHNGKLEATTTQKMPVHKIGVVKEIHKMAYNHGLLYGILCVIIALFVGITMGLVFRDEGGAH
ncbi:MAG: hypothetical protein B5M56_00665 [Desulfococcus sp. 4484_241]|nr:MAG: hypothetical protein B5M56_00665 [Desulfococcus sp. 4484_241]